MTHLHNVFFPFKAVFVTSVCRDFILFVHHQRSVTK